MNKAHVVALSSGASSAVVAKRVIDKFGKRDVFLIFTDTLVEDKDNYRFLDDLEKYFDHPVIRLADGRTPLQVAQDENIIPNSLIAPCTRALKIKPMIKALKELQTLGWKPVIYLGIGPDEAHRREAPIKNYAKIGVEVVYPLFWDEPIHEPKEIVESWGLKLPRMYNMGFKHANCGNQGCVRMGKKDWKKIAENFPEAFQRTVEWENKMRSKFPDHAILKSKRMGETVYVPLSSIVDEPKTKTQDMIDDIEFGCSLECGVGNEGDFGGLE